jgi:mannose-6-phosphate isomerase-like protein (cupin superfamily)
MRSVLVLLAVFATAATPGAQRRGGGGAATLAISVSDASGSPISGVLVTTEGAVTKSARTEGGRIAFEGLPAGSYRLRFEREGFITFEREVAARGGAPIDVKVTLKALPPPPAPPQAPPAPPRVAADAKLVVLDIPSVIENGRAPGPTTVLACGGESTSALLQVKQPLAEHAHADADEVIYVIAGEGSALVEGTVRMLQAGAFLFVPRGMPHTLRQSGRKPLWLISTRAGDACGG